MLIAHVTDLHVLEAAAPSRTGYSRARLKLLSNGRPVDPRDRRDRVARALEEVRAADPDHICVTGDLTEDGSEAQFDALAEIFAASGLDPAKITLVPGNHDAYTRADGFERALEGPLVGFRGTSTLGTVVELDSIVVLPVSTAMPQSFIRAAGFVGAEGRARLARGLSHAKASRLPALVAMHHPPVREGRNPLAWFDELLDARDVVRVLEPFEGARILHGHLHQHTDARVGAHPFARAHGARAVADHVSPVRFYEIDGDGLVEVR